MKHSRLSYLSPLALAILVVVPAAADVGSSETFDAIMKPYEEIRLALVGDSMDGIDERAAAIREEAEAKLDTADDEVRPLLPQVTDFADDLAAAEDLAAAREAFYELSKTLVQYRSKLAGDDLPLVMYCPMAKKSWLQLAEKVGNPYEGKSMASCGNVVGQ